MRTDKIVIIRMSRSSWFKIVYRDKVIHLDPGYAGFFENQGTPLSELEQKADYIFISHPHKDHLRAEVVMKLSDSKTKIICPPACSHEIRQPVKTINPGDFLQDGDLGILAVDAYNTPEGHSVRKLHAKGDFVGYVITFGEKRLYFAGDTDFIPEMKNILKLDVAFLPIGGTYVMDHAEACVAAIAINPKILVPMHQAESDMGSFKSLVESRSKCDVRVLQVGEQTVV